MKIRLALLVAALLAVSATKGAAQKDSRWSEVSEAENTVVSIDHGSIRRHHEHLRVWVRWEYRTTRSAPGGQRYRTRLSLQAVDCAERRGHVIQAVLKDAAGNVVTSVTAPTVEWNYASPNSIGEKILDAVCAYAEAQSL